MSEAKTFHVDAAMAGERLDRCLTELCSDQSRSYLQRLIEEGRVRLNGERTLRKSRVKSDDQITVDWPDESQPDLVPENFTIPILYEDDDLLVLNKPPGMTVHPGAGTSGGTLVNALLGFSYEEFAEQMDEQQRPGIVHRLDKDTSGAIIVARRAPIRRRLSELFAKREVAKTYLAIVAGQPPASCRLKTLIGRHPVKRKTMAVLEDQGKVAITNLRTRDIQGQRAIVEVGLETGRTHQIRVHLAHAGTPIIGDRTYGRRFAKEAPRQMLHAWRLAFDHPVTGARLTVTAPPPDDFRQTCLQDGLTIPEAPSP